MRFNAEQFSQKVVAAPATALLAGALSISSAPGEVKPLDVYMPPIEEVEVTCVNVSGFEPFTEATCARLARNAQAGVMQFSELTGNEIEPPHRFTHRILPGTVQIDDAPERRCINLITAMPSEATRMYEIVNTATEAALRIAPDPSVGVVIGVNSPVDDCGVKPGRIEDWLAPPNDRCVPPPPHKVGYLAARAMIDRTSRAAVFTFVGANTEMGDIVTKRDIVHEWGHLGRGWTRLAHEYGLCDLKSDQLPSSIGA